jgi:polar amino acid transport system substrate-binding protein
MAEPKGRAVLRLLAGLLAGLTMAGAALAAGTDPLDVIRQRGSITVGVKSDYPLFGQVGPNGRLEGLEIDIAKDLAQRLGVGVEFAVVTSANRLQRLEDGTIDLAIATLGDTEQRRSIVTMLEPNYYASGVNLMVPPGSTVHDWAELRGKPVCATQGAYFNRLIAERYLVDLQLFGNNRDAKLAVRAGRCVGWVYDDTAIASDLVTQEWAGWKMPLASTLITPWAMALPRAAHDSQLRRAIEDIIGEWHRGGHLIELERRWKIPPSNFLRHTNELWKLDSSPENPACHRLGNGLWPEDCRNLALLTSVDAAGIRRLGLFVKEQTGLDFSIIYDQYDRASFTLGLLRTLLLITGSMFGALLSGIVAATLIDRRTPVMSTALRAMLTVSRMTPPLLQIYIVFFGVGGWLALHWGLVIDPMLAVFLCLSAYAGAATGQALLEAAMVLSARFPGFRIGRATLGRTLHAARGSIFGILVNIAKATGMASVVAVPEMISATTAIMAERGNVSVMMNVLMISYFLIIFGTVLLLDRLQRRLSGLLPRQGPSEA